MGRISTIAACTTAGLAIAAAPAHAGPPPPTQGNFVGDCYFSGTTTIGSAPSGTSLVIQSPWAGPEPGCYGFFGGAWMGGVPATLRVSSPLPGLCAGQWAVPASAILYFYRFGFPTELERSEGVVQHDNAGTLTYTGVLYGSVRQTVTARLPERLANGCANRGEYPAQIQLTSR